jgi:hypothetical protein
VTDPSTDRLKFVTGRVISFRPSAELGSWVTNFRRPVLVRLHDLLEERLEVRRGTADAGSQTHPVGDLLTGTGAVAAAPA